MFSHAAFFAMLQVILIDIVLAGDNAIVIGIAASRVAAEARKKVIFWGLLAAVVARVVLALLTTTVLNIPGLMFIGGILLIWVASRLWRDLRADRQMKSTPDIVTKRQKETDDLSSAAGLGDPQIRRVAIQVAVADLSMSLDNVLAVAGAAVRHPWVLVAGLALSVALMGFAAKLVADILNKHRWLSYAGVIIVLFVGIRMIAGGADSFFSVIF